MKKREKIRKNLKVILSKLETQEYTDDNISIKWDQCCMNVGCSMVVVSDIVIPNPSWVGIMYNVSNQFTDEFQTWNILASLRLENVKICIIEEPWYWLLLLFLKRITNNIIPDVLPVEAKYSCYAMEMRV